MPTSSGKDKICVLDEILKTFTSSQYIYILSGNPLPQQDQDCDRQRAQGGVRAGAQEGLQTHHQDGSSAEISEGVCGCSKGSLCYIQSQSREEEISNYSEMVLYSRGGDSCCTTNTNKYNKRYLLFQTPNIKKELWLNWISGIMIAGGFREDHSGIEIYKAWVFEKGTFCLYPHGFLPISLLPLGQNWNIMTVLESA